MTTAARAGALAARKINAANNVLDLIMPSIPSLVTPSTTLPIVQRVCDRAVTRRRGVLT
jgi:hypothetical protein